MKTSEIKILLQKFYDGMSSPDEELFLEEYFLKGQIDPDLETDERYFRELKDLKSESIEIPDDLESLVLNRLQSEQDRPERKSNRLIYIILSSAATVLLLVSSLFFLSQRDHTPELRDLQVAYAESLQALETVSSYLNQGTEGLANLNKLNEAVEPLKNLNSIQKATKELSLLSKLGNVLDTTHEIVGEK